MKTSTKAALISALVFPGAGHLYLKKFVSAAVLVGVTLLSLYYLVVKTVESATYILEQMQTGSAQLDDRVIAEMLSAQSAGNDSLLLNIASIAILVCWVTGIIDSYRTGKTQENSSSGID